MSGMFWIALELSISKIGLNIMLSLTVKKLDAFRFDGVGESDNTGSRKRGYKHFPAMTNTLASRVMNVSHVTANFNRL